MYSQPQKTYGIAAAQDAVPLGLGSSTLQKPIPSNVKTVAIVSSNGTQSANGMLSFTIPTGAGAGYCKSGSMYLRAKVTQVGGAAGTGAITWGFKGPLHSAANIVRTCSIFVGGALVDQIQNYGLCHDMQLSHCTNNNFLSSDAAIMQASSVDKCAFAVDAAGSTRDVAIPIISSVFNSQKHMPLFLLNSPVLIQIDLETLFNAIITTSTAGSTEPSNYTVSEAMLVFENISVDESYKESVKMAMNEGRLYQLNLQQWQNAKVQKGAAATLTYNFGLNTSSTNGLFWAISQDPATQGAERLFLSRGVDATCDFRVLLDGIQVENQQLNSVPVIYAELQKALGNLLDPTQSFAAPGATVDATITNYTTKAFTGAVNFRRFNEQMAMTGLPCQNLQFTLTTATNNANDIVYVFVLYESILTIDASGAVVLIR
jgi:hypothetical protein